MANQFLTRGEASQFDVAKLIQSMQGPVNPGQAKFENDLADQFAAYTGRTVQIPALQMLTQGKRTPYEVYRDETTTTASSVVPSRVADEFLPIIEQGNPIVEMGGQSYPNQVANFSVPRVDNETTYAAELVEEGNESTEQTPTTDLTSYSPHEIMIQKEASRKIYQQTFGLRLLTMATVNKLQWMYVHQILHGSNVSGEINGLSTNTKVSEQSGAGMTWEDANDAVKTLAGRGLDSRRMFWLMHPTDAATLRTRPRIGGGEVMMIERNELASVAVREHSAVDQGTLFLADWSYMLLASWGGVDLITNPYSKDISGLIRLTARIYVDGQPRNGSAFLKVTSFS